MVKILPAMRETWVQFLGQEDTLEKGMVTHSTMFARKIPRREESGGLQPIGSQKSDMTEQLIYIIKLYIYICIYSVQFSRSVMSDTLRPHEPQYTRPPCLSLTPGVHPNPCPLSR